jgi:transposase-like protein
MPLSDPMQLARVLNPPNSLREFSLRFATEAACEEFLFSLRHPKGFICPRCGIERGWPLDGKRLIECANGHKVSLTAGTVLHRTRQDLVTWFHAAYLVSTLTPGISALQFQSQLGLKRYETAFQMLHKLRSAMVAPGREPLHHEVEVDDTFIGGKDPGQDGRGGDKTLVVGAVELIRWIDPKNQRDRVRSGRLRLRVVPNASSASFVPFVRDVVERGAVVHTDAWSGYLGLEKAGYAHQPVSQGKGQSATYTLPHIHRIFSNLDTWLQGTHRGRVRPRHLQAYLNEFTFRFNRRFWRGPAFLRALGLMVGTADRPTYEALYLTGRVGGWVHPGLGGTTKPSGSRT